MDISMIATLLKRLAAICFAFLIFWHVTPHTAPRRGRAIVHVSQSDVAVIVDHQSYRVPTVAESPVVCQLHPGKHWAQVWRHGVLLGEVRFTVEAGKEVVIPPFDRAAIDAIVSSGPAVPAAERIDAAGLAASFLRSAPTIPSY